MAIDPIYGMYVHDEETDTDGVALFGSREAEDIRTGYDGIAYANAGDAVRGQVDNLSTELGNTGAVIIGDNWVNGYVLVDGTSSDTSTSWKKQVIDVPAGYTLRVEHATNYNGTISVFSIVNEDDSYTNVQSGNSSVTTYERPVTKDEKIIVTVRASSLAICYAYYNVANDCKSINAFINSTLENKYKARYTGTSTKVIHYSLSAGKRYRFKMDGDMNVEVKYSTLTVAGNKVVSLFPAEPEKTVVAFEDSDYLALVCSVGTAFDFEVSEVLTVEESKELTKKYYPSTVLIDQNGYGQFTTLRSAVDAVKAYASADNPYEILINEGEYDVLADFTDDEIEQANVPTVGYDDNTFVGVKLTDGISLRGIGDKEKVILKGYLDPNVWGFEYRRNISTINLSGNCNIENLTVTGEQLRYCVHDDFSYKANGRFERNFKDVILVPISTTSGMSYGAGLSGGAINGRYVNCDFGHTFAFHTNANRKNSSIVLESCKGRLSNFGDLGSRMDVYFENCDFEFIKIYNESTSQSQNLFLHGSNGDAIINAPSGYLYDTGEVSTTYASNRFPVGVAVRRNTSAYSHEFEPTNNKDLVYGVVIARDMDYVYVQHSGGFCSNIITAIASAEVGDYVTLDANGLITMIGATESNACGIVTGKETDGTTYAVLF